MANETTGLFAAKDVGTGIGVTTAMTLTGANASQFTLTAQPTLVGDITPKDLRVVNAVVTIKVYDGSTVAGITGAGLDLSAPGQGTSTDGKAYTGDAVGLSSVTTGQFADKNVGTGKTVTLTAPITLTGTDAGNYTLLNQPSLTGTITAKDLSVFSAAVTTKVYDGSDAAVVTGAVLVGNSTADNDGKYIGMETVTLGNAGSGTFASKNVGVAKTVTTTMTLGGVDAGNYTLNTQPTLTGDITAKALTISATTPSTVAGKIYNGNTSASVTVGALDGVVAGEVLGVTTAVGTFADKNIGTKNVTAVYTLVDGANPLHLASNYTLASETLTGTITAKDLSVFSAAVTTKVYDGSDAAVVTGAVLVGNSTADNDGKYIGSEVVTLNGGSTGTFASKNVGAGQAVTTAMTLGGSDAGNYTLNTQPTLTGTITAKALSMSGSLAATKVYDGTVTAAVTLGTQTGEVAGEILGTTTAAGTFADRNVGTGKSVTAVYTLANGANPQHLASNYSLANDTLSADITAKDLVVDVSGVTISKVYDGLFSATFTGATLSSEAVGTGTTSDGKYYTIDTVTLKDGGTGTFASRNVGAGITVTTSMSLDGLNKGNYTLGVQPTLTGTITAKALTMTGSSAGNKVYDGTANASVSIGALSGLVVGESLGTTTAAGTFADRNVGTGKSVTAVYTLANGANAAANYSLANDTLAADITAKALTVSGGAVTTKAYDGTTVATITGAGLQSAIAAGTGSSTDGKPYSVDSVTLSGGGAGVFERNLPGTMIPVSTTMSVTGTGSGNYIVTQPTGLKGEITGSATLNRNGAAISVASTPDIHIRNTTATRMQDGLTISSATGSVLLENSSFDGWMQRSTPGTKIDDGGAVTFQFTEGAAVAVNSPVLRLKMEANNPAAAPSAGGANLDYMLLGDYQLHLRHDPDGIANNGDEAATTVFSFPGKATDPSGIGSLAPSADLVIRDSALTQMKDLPWDTQSFSSLDVNGEAVASGSYATAAGEYKPDGPAAMSDLNTTTSVGKWDVTVSDPALGGEGKVTDLRLKYNNNTKALIEGPDGVRLVNVKFEGMDEVEVKADKADLNNRILRSGTLVSDPNISKMVVKAGQTMEAQLASDVTMREINTSAGDAQILAGVKPDPANPGKYLDIVGGTERILEMQTANIAGQLTLAAHTMVFNNANITSAGVIEARTRDGMVNRTYGNVVPGTVSFIGANGNHFLNTLNTQSMTIANSGHISSALSGGQMSENGAGGATVMNVGKLR
ncbi:MAG: hypothetical protein EBU81_03225 [Proteobacteria bacterium]|nr:hypothetical protein [Pseudomonadota bacterium]